MNKQAPNYNTFAVEPDANNKALHATKRKENYRVNKHSIPPNFEQSQKHRIATRAAIPTFVKENGEKVDLDPATGNPVEIKEFKYCCNPKDFSELAPAYPMYFEFVKSSIYLLTLLFLVSGIYNFATNWQGKFCQDPATLTDAQMDAYDVCVLNFATRSSLANTHNGAVDFMEKFQDWLNLGGFLALIVYLQWFRYTQRKTAVECDQLEWTAADFTLFVRGIPKDLKNVNVEKELEEYFINHGLPNGQKVNVKRVILTFNVKDMNINRAAIQKKLKEIKKIRQRQLDAAEKKDNKENNAPLLDEIIKLRSEIRALEEQNLNLSEAYFAGTGLGFTGCAFVTVNTQKEANEIADHWGDPDFIQKLYRKFATKEKFHGANLRLRAAPEPSDVYWENLVYSTRQRLMRVIIIVAVTIVILAGIWSVIYFLTYEKNKKVEEWNNNPADLFKIALVSYGVTLAIQAFNYALVYIINFTTELEKNVTWTARKISSATKLAWAQFLVTAIVELIICIKFADIWGYGGLVTTVTQVFEINMITPVAVLIINPFYWMNLIVLKLASRKGEKSNLTQAESDRIHEMPEFELSAKYALILKNMYSAAFYAPLLPIALPLTILGNLFIYWADKYVLVRKSSLSKALGANLAKQMLENMEWVLVVYAVGNIVFNKLIFGTVTIPAYIAITLAAVNALLPMAEINESITPSVKEQETEDTFDKKKWEFEEDYDRCNPATRAYSVARFEAESRGEVFSKEAAKDKILDAVKNKGFMGSSLSAGFGASVKLNVDI